MTRASATAISYLNRLTINIILATRRSINLVPKSQWLLEASEVTKGMMRESINEQCPVFFFATRRVARLSCDREGGGRERRPRPTSSWSANILISRDGGSQLATPPRD